MIWWLCLVCDSPVMESLINIISHILQFAIGSGRSRKRCRMWRLISIRLLWFNRVIMIFYMSGCSYGSVASFSSPWIHMSTPAHGKRVTVHSEGLIFSQPPWGCKRTKVDLQGEEISSEKRRWCYVSVFFTKYFLMDGLLTFPSTSFSFLSSTSHCYILGSKTI